MAFKQYKPTKNRRDPAFYINEDVLRINYSAICDLNMEANKLNRASLFYDAEQNKIKLLFHKTKKTNSVAMSKVNNSTSTGYAFQINAKKFFNTMGIDGSNKRKIKNFY